MSTTPCEKKLTKRKQKALAFRKNQGQKSKLITDNEKNVSIEIDNKVVESEKSKRKYIKEVGELKIEKKKHKRPKNYKESQETEKDTGVNDVEDLDKSIKEENYLNDEQLYSDQNDKCENIEDRIVQDNQKKDGSNNIKLNKKSSPRFIVFVANLPYNTKGEELSKHFESAGVPISIRLITDKNTKKQKGFAFIEFDNSQSMKKALIFHHTIFKNRQIRVELTAGGGGNKSEIRRKKLEQKKKKLEDERRKFHKNYVAPAKSKPKDINRNELTSMLKTTSQSDNKVQTKVKKPRLKGSNSIKLNNIRAFG
ncbi:RNA-binding domain-containing protein [Gigaspora margarita]|uniref:RNA-binding domain-containing protein n=1 Tax=Gigaspora margarita TaxID=4874 RepID=A0A8H4A1Z5_GIGMA|nr:RNA-binding domain-containing protein [Gigaspora margarita]